MESRIRWTQEPLPSFEPSGLVVHYSELALKGRNRDWFEGLLVSNLRSAMAEACPPPRSAGDPRTQVQRLYGRILVSFEGGVAWREVLARITRVFGVAHVLPVQSVEPTLERIQEAALRLVEGVRTPRRFAVKCKRSTKDFPFDSMEVQKAVGGAIRTATGWPVDLGNPEITFRFECVNRRVYLGLGRAEGAGGMPSGVSGRVVSLLSGGIDSPVAAYRILRRGARVIHVHFHSHPYTGIESQHKVEELARLIQPPGSHTHLYSVPFAALQRKIATLCAAPLRILLYRRFMFRVAEAIAHREGALALVTGENLGQVASQTLENLHAIDLSVTLPVLRPLIGLDKQEIIAEAERIGTFVTSIEPHGDCCSFLMPANPSTHSTPAALEEEERKLDVPLEVSTLVQESRRVEILPAGTEGPRCGEAPVSAGQAP